MKAGILLPETILDQPWFAVFALFVALNTIVYLGLTLAKVIPWPDQVHPNTVRASLPASWIKDGTAERIMEDQMTAEDVRQRSAEENADPFAKARSDSARATVPLGLAFLGALIVLFSLVNIVLSPAQQDFSRLISVAFGLTMLILAQTLDRRQVRTATMVLVMAAMTVLFTAQLSWDAVKLDSPVTLTYCIIALTVMPAITLSWRPALATGIMQWVIIVAAGYFIRSVDTLLWAVAALSGLLAGMVILRLRLNNIDRLTLEELRRNVAATLDPLTGLLSRQGLASVADSVDQAITNPDQELFIMELNIEAMTEINRKYGLDYGDAVIESTAQTLRSMCSPGEQAARWSGDTFLLLGFGDRPEAGAFAERVNAAIADSGLALGKTPITVRARVVSGHNTSFQELVVGLMGVDTSQRRPKVH